jgi:glycosyltransferase involved in cell wall biosynthesis
MKVLAFVDYYLPGYRAGGPIPAIRNLVAALAGQVVFRIVTRDRDLGDTRPYASAASGWQPVGGANVCYLPPSPWARVRALREVMRTPHDVLFLNSLFSIPFTGVALCLRALRLVSSRAVLLAPRGECAPGALGLHPRRKRWYLRLTRLLGMYRGVTWQASGPHEAADIARLFGPHARIVLAPDLPTLAVRPAAPASPKRAGLARLAFLGRISRMKNLEVVVDVLQRVRSAVQCDVYGPVEDAGYWQEIVDLAAALPPFVRFVHHGPLAPDDVGAMFAAHDALFLPTRGENFGYVILEALAAGCPAIISDRTRWQALEAEHAGWVYPLEARDAFAACIDALAARDAAAHAPWVDGARSVAERYSADPSLGATARDAFDQALAAGGR